jgi:hypothetical protein
MAGRANAALSVFQLGGALVVQSVTGIIIQQWTSENGHYPAVAYQVAFAFNVSLQILALIWFTWSKRRRYDPVWEIQVPHQIFRFERAPDAAYRNAALVWNELLVGTQMQLCCWRLAAFGSAAVVVLLSVGLVASTARSVAIPYVLELDRPSASLDAGKLNLVRRNGK